MKIALLFDGASAFATNPDMLILGTVEALEQSLAVEQQGDFHAVPATAVWSRRGVVRGSARRVS